MTTHTPAECWHPENWDAVTLAWLHSPEGAADLALVKAAPYLLEACRIALKLPTLVLFSETSSSAHRHSERRADEYASKQRAALQQIEDAIAKADRV